MIWSSTASGHITYASPDWVAFTGQPETEALGNGWLSYLHPDDVEPTKKSFAEALALKAPFTFRYRLRHKELGYVPIVVAATPSFSPLDGSFIGYIGAITEAKALSHIIPTENVIGYSTYMPAGILTARTKPYDKIADLLLMARAIAVGEGSERMLASLDFAISEIMRIIGREIHNTVQ